MGDPYCLRRPEAPDLGRFAQHRKSVRGEREQAVELARQPGAPEARKKVVRSLHRRLEVGGRERHLRRGDRRFRVAEDVFRIHQQGLVPVGADADGVTDLPEVRRGILVPQDRQGNLLPGAGQFRHGGGDGVEVLHRRQRDFHPGEAADPGTPDAGRGHYQVRADGPVSSLHRCNAAIAHAKAGDRDAAVERRAVARRLTRHGLRRPGRRCLDVRGNVERAQDAVGQHREQASRLGRAKQVGLHAPTQAVAGLAFQVGEPLRRPRRLKAAHRPGAGLAIELHLRPQPYRVPGEGGHGLRRIDLKHEARRMAGRAARFEQRTLLDDDDVPPAQLRQVVGHAAAGNARADNHYPGVSWDCSLGHFAPAPPSWAKADGTPPYRTAAGLCRGLRHD